MTDKPVLGFQDPNSTAGDLNSLAFVIEQLLGKMATITLVQVAAVHIPAGTPPQAVGSVDVTPLVNQIDGAGNPTPHGTINNVPYFRVQGGLNAVVIDPVVGDIGLCAFASRDISKVKTTKKAANPGSFRRYDYADGLYIGGFLNGAPQQYIIFKPSNAGIDVISPTEITCQAPTVTVQSTNANVNATATATVTAPTVLVKSNNTQLGDAGGPAVARVGDSVNLSTGLITTGSAKVTAA